MSAATTIRIARVDGSALVLDGAALARAFFADEAEDAVAGPGAPDRIETVDVLALNRTMRARSPHAGWAELVDVRLPWLARIDPALDLLETGDRRWASERGQELVEEALAAVVGPGRNVAVATKMLHLKRPRLFPMLDRLVVEMLGGGLAPEGAAEVRARQAATLVAHLRTEGRANLRAARDPTAAGADGCASVADPDPRRDRVVRAPCGAQRGAADFARRHNSVGRSAGIALYKPVLEDGGVK